MKLTVTKKSLKILTDSEARWVAGGGKVTPALNTQNGCTGETETCGGKTTVCTGVTGTECGITYLPECGTTGTESADCGATALGCGTDDTC
jgi:hypothetical protein